MSHRSKTSEVVESSSILNVLILADSFAPTFLIGLGTGRIGNFIHDELYGRISDVPRGMVFSRASPEPRHPNPFYQLFCEGVILFFDRLDIFFKATSRCYSKAESYSTLFFTFFSGFNFPFYDAPKGKYLILILALISANF